MSKNLRFCAFVLFCLLLPVAGWAQELPFTHYRPESETNPLPSAEVSAVHQDRTGLIWFVIFSSGLVRYDGHTFELYTTADGLGDVEVWDINEDRSGRLWVGSNGGLVVSEKPLGDYAPGERVRFVSRIGTHALPHTTIDRNRIAVDPSGRVWAGTIDTGIVRIADVVVDTLRTDVTGDGKNAVVRAIVARRDGSVWASIVGGDLLVFEKDAPSPQVIPAPSPGQNVNVLYEGKDGVLRGGCFDGLLFHIDESGGQHTVVADSRALAPDIMSILMTAEGDLWATSEGGGAMRLSRDQPPLLVTRTTGLISETVHRVMQDAEGNLWFAQSGGVSRLRTNYRAFANYTATARAGESGFLPSPAINAVLPPIEGLGVTATWLSTSESGIVCFDDSGRVQSIGTSDGLRNNWVNNVVFDEKGRLWVGTASGINCLAPDRSMFGAGAPRHAPETSQVQLFGKPVYITNYIRRSIYACESFRMSTGEQGESVESLWFPAFRHLFCLVGGEWLDFRMASGLPETFLHSVAFDGDGRLLVGTRDHGIFRSTLPLTTSMLASLKRTPLPFPAGEGVGNFGSEIVETVFEPLWSGANQIDAMIWKDSMLWVGTPDGVFALEGDPLRVAKHLTRDDGLRANNGTSMAFSPSGSLWVGTNGGLSEVDPATRVVRRSITRRDGLVDNEVWFLGSVATAADGTIYFGTAKGLAVYQPALDVANTIPPPIVFRRTSFEEDNRGNNELSLEYAALSFADEKRVRYRTRLVGYDKDWTVETADFKTRYTNLGAFLVSRTYTFEVQACNNAGVWTTEALTHDIAVTPAWWIRWWSMLGQLVLLAGVVVGVGVYRTRALAERNRMLEHTVQERTAEVRAQAETLQEQNIELDEKNQEIMRTQQQLIVQEKLASLGQLTAGIAHEIRNPLNFVNNFAQLSGGLVEELREDITANKEKLGEKSAEYIESIIQDLEGNLKRINDHGKRADGIVQGMLMHSRGQKGERAPVKLNALIDEQAQLAYLSMRNSKPDMSVVFKKEYDDTIGEIPMIPQDLSRVFINIINNACYAAEQRKAKMPPDWMPLITMTTKNLGDKVEVRIRDNGTGMPESVREKIFNPFFTTKPTGEGTGLGLSISYDIVVQEHKGTIKVESQENEFTEFTIELPRK